MYIETNTILIDILNELRLLNENVGKIRSHMEPKPEAAYISDHFVSINDISEEDFNSLIGKPKKIQ